MPPALKRKSTTPDLDLDALFADLDSSANQYVSQVQKRTSKTRRLSKTPAYVSVSSEEREPSTSSSAVELVYSGTSSRTRNQVDREMQLQMLCDGLDQKESKVLPFSTPTRSRTQVTPSKGNEIEDYDLGALVDGVDWDEEFVLTPAKPTRSKKSTPKTPTQKAPLLDKAVQQQVRDSCTRCVVLSVMETRNVGRLEKSGDIVNLIGDYALGYSWTQPTMTVSSTRNMIILHPDILIPATSVSEAPRCIRKPILSNLIRSPLDVTPSTIFGHMLHEVMQSCLASGEWSKEFIEEKITHAVRSSLDRLIRVNVGIEEARVEMRMRARGLEEFSKRFIADKPKPDAFLTERRSTASTPARIALTQLHDVEETIWSPTYGLKGVVDASMQAHIIEEEKLWPADRSWTLPLEIKTGRSAAELAHRAQTALYTLLMSERYGVQIPNGLLYYTQSKEILRVQAARNEIRGLIVARNEMALYMTARTYLKSPRVDEITAEPVLPPNPKPFLPPTINDEWTCSKCYAVDSCMLYRKAIDGVVDDGSPISELYQRKTGHLTEKHLEFFRHWESLIALEESDLNLFRRELWTMTAEARQKSGRCFADMVISSSHNIPLEETEYSTKDQRYIYEFVRSPKAARFNASGLSLLDGFMSVNDAVCVSVEPNLLAFARGFVVGLEPARVTVALDREIDSAITERGLTDEQKKKQKTEGIVYRIDRDELSTTMNRIRNNLTQLFYEKGDKKRRSLIVDLAPPTFDESRIPPDADIPPGLNESQAAALRKVMAAKDYALILGMPGTGKTTTIAEIIKGYVKMGKSVLLTSYTHSAVDTILLKLVNTNIKVLRLGNIDKVHPDVRHFSVHEYNTATTIEQLEQQLLAPPVVATTCLSIDQKGLEDSLFRILCNAHPETTVDLVHQYRMNEDIMLLCNNLIYNNRLQCGSSSVANRKLGIPDPTFIDNLHRVPNSCTLGTCWLSEVLDERSPCRRKVIFIDTDDLPAEESRVSDLVQNEVEASLVYQIANALFASGVTETQVGIISLYRQQNKLLSLMLSQYPDVEVMTVDRSQGRDKDCVIISMVRSNDQGNTGDLLRDWRRINVALTRARSKLVVIGSRNTLKVEPLLAKFLALIDKRGWILRLPKGANTFHEDVLPGNSNAVVDARHCPRRSKQRVEAVLKGRGLLRDVVNAI
ncbi:AAA domain-containing protein [Cantharellus anzutake]|uniref:AAA domain-containing protein n=1 Tax=Cantharellus anzutake TaxID=1750568 RepID=UPI001903054A|nr:AAA domain-containing protein [Cantharellus anzutake]KAF8326832.1 AAA domain-containing protein [Cantharellus anzutake]